MLNLPPAAVGVLTVFLGLAFLIGVYFAVTRFVPRLKPSGASAIEKPIIQVNLDAHRDAVLAIAPGGKVIYTNQLTREWFGVWEEDPNLERLARRARPAESFLSLCATEGQARFALEGRITEGTSYYVPGTTTEQVLLVTMRRPQVTTLASGETTAAGSPEIEMITELTRSMAASLEVEPTLQAILNAVERLVPADFSEITIWDEENKLLIPYRFVGLPGVDRHLEKTAERYRSGEGYSGYLIAHKQPLLVKDVDGFREVRPVLDRRKYPFRAYLGVPLLLAGETVGTLELASLSKEAFTEADLNTIQILSGQAAIALHNAVLFEQEQIRSAEMTGLAKLAQVATSLNDPQDLYNRLIESIAPLFNVEILGLLIYDETRRTLYAQKPFSGLPAEFIGLYRLTFESGSALETFLRSPQTLLIEDVPTNPKIETLGFNHVAQAAGMRDMLLSPLTSSGRLLGFLQLANSRDQRGFDEDDLRLIAIVAGQVAPMLDNIYLMQQSQRRAQRAEALRRIAALSGSAATLDEILKYSLQELSQMLNADVALILLLEEQRGELRLHRNSMLGISNTVLPTMQRFAVDDPAFQTSITNTQGNFFTGQANQPDQLPAIYRPLFNELQIRSLVVMPLVVRDRGIGEMALASRQTEAFNRADVLFVTTAAGQMAGAIERSMLYSQTDEHLRRRVEELTALTRISRELNSTLDFQHLLRRVFDEAQRITQADNGVILLFDLSERAGESKQPRIMLNFGVSVENKLHPLELQVVHQDEPLIVDDFEQTPHTPRASGSRSALIVPVTYQERAVGLIHLWSKRISHFDSVSLEVAETLAMQAAIALGNAIRYQEQARRNEMLNRRVETLSKLMESARAQKLDHPLEEAMEAIAYAIQESTPFNIVLISIYDPEQAHLLRLAGAGFTLEQFEALRSRTQPWRSVQEFFQPEYRLGRSYFVPTEHKPVDPPDIHLVYTDLVIPTARGDSANWDPDDLLVTPLFSSNGEPLGLISVDAPRNGLRPDRPTIETLELFASQAALTIESHVTLQRMNRDLEQNRRRLESVERTAENAQQYLPVMLNKDLEQTIVVQQLSQRTRRIRAGLDIAEVLNRQGDRESVLFALGREILTRMDLDLALVVERSPGGPRLLNLLGPISPDVNPDALLGQRNPLRHVLQTGQALLIADLEGSNEWHGTPLLTALEAKGFVCLPIAVDTGPEAAILAISQSPLSAFTAEDEQLYALIARQAALTLQNLKLLTETSYRLREVNLLLEFSRQLGSLDQKSILHTLVDSALQVTTHADAGFVALWDERVGALLPQAASGYPNTTLMMQITYRSGEALPGRVFETGKILRVPDVDFARDYNLSSENLLRYRDATQGRLPVSSLLIPIQSGENRWGVLVLDNFRESDAFSLEDQALTNSLTQQTALALENARLYQASERRAVQLQSLTDVAGTISSSLEFDALVQTLLDQLKQVVAYETGTLWLRQGQQMTVRAARGFDNVQERLGLSVALEDSRLMAEMIRTGRPVVVADVREDERFPSLIEPQYLSWLSLPLIAKGEVVGVIALEATEPGFYTPENVQVATAFASQAAVSLENARLFEESVSRARELNQRTQRLALLNRLSVTLSGSLEIDYILETITNELFQAIPCSAISVVLFDNIGKATVMSESPRFSEKLPLLLPDAPLFNRLRQSLGVFNTEDIRAEEDLQPLLSYLKRHKTRSLLVLPIATGNDLHGLMLIHENRRQYRFAVDEIDLARTISNQAAISVQNARLYEETQRQVNELSALSAISRGMSATVEFDELMAKLPAQLSGVIDTRDMYLALYDSERDLVSFPINFEDGVAFESPTRPPTGLTGHIIRTGKSLLLVGEEGLAQMEALGAVQIGSLDAMAYLGVPMFVGNRLVGVLSIQDPRNPYAYTFDDERLLSTIASQVAIAIENSRLYTEARQRTDELALLFDFSVSISDVLDEQRLIDTTFDYVQRALSVESVALVLRRADNALVAHMVDHDKFTHNLALPGDGSSFSEHVLRTGQPFLIRDMDAERSSLPVQGVAVGSHVRSWLGVPLLSRGNAVGVISVQSYTPNRFVESQVRLVSQIANQLSVALENAGLLSTVQRYATELEEHVAERTEELAREHERTQMLLSIITELSASLDMDIVLNRTLALINQIVGAEQSTILLVEGSDNLLTRRASEGYTLPTPDGGVETFLKMDEGLAGWVIRHHQAICIQNVLEDDRWIENPQHPTQHRSALIVPLMVGEEILGVLSLFHRQIARFDNEHVELVEATARQIAVALNNAKLYRLIADQAERLGDMLRTQHIETSRSQAILEAVADGVLVTDSHNKITLFNASAERILEISRKQVLSNSLDQFSGFFGKAAGSWMNTIRTWSKDASAYSRSDVFAERIELDDGRVISVHLSPVLLRSEFLGTVSIFRDITHEVEVDRLKSEFVANVSHELRTPMTSIKGYVEIMLMGAAGALNDQQRNFLGVVKANTERLIILVNDLLDVSRMDAGQVVLVCEPLEIHTLAANLINEMKRRSQQESRPMNFELRMDEGLPRVYGDPERVKQILENLVENAYRYTPENGNVTITLHPTPEDFVQIDVRDTGVGIPPAEQQRVFERFYRGENPLVMASAGTGLGLSVVQTLIEMHGGRIWLESTGIPGEGSTFSFTLPIYRTESSASPAA